MGYQNTNESMLEMFLFETNQLIEQLEEEIMVGEKEGGFSQTAINEIFRIMHTIKGSASMMMFQNISTLAHSMEDIFYYLRENLPTGIDYSLLSDLVLEGIDFVKLEIEKIRNKDEADGNADELLRLQKDFLVKLKGNPQETENPTAEQPRLPIAEQKNSVSPETEQAIYQYAYRAVVFFEEGCEMENIRAFTILRNLKVYTHEIYYYPEDILEDEDSALYIRKKGFQLLFKCNEAYDRMQAFFHKTIFLKEIELEQLDPGADLVTLAQELSTKGQKEQITIDLSPVETVKSSGNMEPVTPVKGQPQKEAPAANGQQSIISVSVPKLDKLMDLVGEMVIAEAMVIQNPDLAGLELSNFEKAARQLHKITSEIQDTVMSIRMVPLSTTFHKMHRIIRDMSRKLSKDIELDIIGEETEVDKNIIEHISDPLMHLVRNSADHGIESAEDRLTAGKPDTGTITLEAKNAGSDVLIIVRDDGRGLDRTKLLNKAKRQGLLMKNEEDMTEKEIYNLILLPGFSTKEQVTEFSGRGVGMDVVAKNIEAVGGSISVDSTIGKGMTVTLKIPLTLAIIDGMNIKVGNSCYTVPTVSIRESFRPREEDIFRDPSDNEMIMVRGQCYEIRRLHEMFRVKTDITRLSEGIFLMVEQEDKRLCLFADELLGQQQVVVKALPQYIRNFQKIKEFSGCTLLGDGSISLILDIAHIINL
jgi:two-component system chemotaxis sensor kinase CheA